jgi:DNA polymerase-3 subunit delta'
MSATEATQELPSPIGHGFSAIVGQDVVVAALQNAIGRGRLPHALLFVGPAGVGKATTALVLAQALNCPTSGPADACGECVSCSKIVRGIHPDLLSIAPSPREIRIAWITPRRNPPKNAPPESRTVTRFIGYKPFEGRRRVVVIDQAHTMNPEAQNALLKTLEEPPDSTIMILTSSSPGALLPTVRSRCQTLQFSPVGQAMIRDYLTGMLDMEPDEAELRAALSPGSIGRAVDLDLDQYEETLGTVVEALRMAQHGGGGVVTAAESLANAGSGETATQRAASVLTVGRDVLRDLLVVTSGADPASLVNAGQQRTWETWADELEGRDVVGAIEALSTGIERLTTGIQPNIKLALERTLIEVSDHLGAGTGQ